MCCTFEPAELSQTILYGGEHRHPETHRRIHVVGYQNTVQNIHHGPNAMILPFPAAALMGPKNVIDTSATPSILLDMQVALRSTYDGRISLGEDDELGGAACAGSAQVFESGKYTVVLADDPRKIPAALKQVPENRRPVLNTGIMVAYAHWYPKWPVALCCFDAAEMQPADPLLWWYEPMDEKRIFFPTLDAHDGKRPDLTAKVDLDHTFVCGMSTTPRDFRAWGRFPGDVTYKDEIPAEMTHFLPDRIIGLENHQRVFNGDFYLEVSDLRKAQMVLQREPPPNWKALF